MSALCHERLTWLIDASRGGVARLGERWLSAHVMVERMWLDLGWITHARILLYWLHLRKIYSAHYVLYILFYHQRKFPAYINLLLIQGDFVTERDISTLYKYCRPQLLIIKLQTFTRSQCAQ